MTDIVEKKIPPLEMETDDDTDVVVHYFNPVGKGDWYVMRYDPVQQLFFGYVSIFGYGCDELGYFSLAELESVQLPWGRKIERDIYWHERPLRDIKLEIQGGK